jgi:autotransporter-associated beta strand protein
VNGHDQTVNGLTGSGTIDNTAAATSNTLTVGANNQTSTFAGVIQNTGGTLALVKTGTGTVTLSNASTYSGGTSVVAGKLVVSGSLQGSVDVASGATLASGANFTSQVQAVVAHSSAVGGATMSPGNSGGTTDLSTIGQLNATSVTLGDSATLGFAHLSIELGGTNDGSGGGNGISTLQYDRLALTGTLTLTNATLDVSMANNFSAASVGATFNTSVNPNVLNQDGHIFFLITGMSTSVSGTFANDLGASDSNAPWASHVFFGSNGQEYALTYTASFSGNSWTGGNDVAIMAIPEPNSISMLAGSLGVALGLQRFRRRRK